MFPFFTAEVFFNEVVATSVGVGDEPVPTLRTVETSVGHDQNLFDLGKNAFADRALHIFPPFIHCKWLLNPV
jgi:hypothetical protein